MLRLESKHKANYLKRSLAVGSVVELTDGLNAIIRYIGKVKERNGKNKKGIFYGLELNQAKGKNDGYVNGRWYFKCRPKHGLFVKLDRIKNTVSMTENDTNPYSYSTQFFDQLLPVFISFLDNITLCNLLQIKTFCTTFNLKKVFKKLMTPKQFMEQIFMVRFEERKDKLKEVYRKKIKLRSSYLKFAVWNMMNYNDFNEHQKGKDKNKNLRRIACLTLIMQFYEAINRSLDGFDVDYAGQRKMLADESIFMLDETYIVFWKKYQKKLMSFDYKGDALRHALRGKWDSFRGKLQSKKTLQEVFKGGRVFGYHGESLYNGANKCLLAPMMDLMVKEWIILDGVVSNLPEREYYHHRVEFSFIFGWISPDCVVMIGAPHSVKRAMVPLDYWDSD